MKKENIGYIDSNQLDNELQEIDSNMKKIEDEGLKNILKHFDRIHDKLFNFNNFLIAGYFALSKFDGSIPNNRILIPIANMILLILVEFRMMEKSRVESQIRNASRIQIEQWKKGIRNTNIYSLFIIGSTILVTGIFLYYLM